MTYYPADSVDTNHFMNVPWKINGSIRGEERERVGVGGGVVYCATISAGPRSCSGIGYGALDMIRVPSLIPAPLSRPV